MAAIYLDDENIQFVNQLEGTGSYDKIKDNFLTSLHMDSVTGVFGVPYQFLPSVDTRLDTGGKRAAYAFGRKYAEKIVSRLPIMYFSPGNPRFMPKVKDTSANLVKTIVGWFTRNQDGLKSLIEEYQGKYYYIDLAYTDYYHYVNPMCRIGAAFLGIQDRTYRGCRLDKFPWHLNTGAERHDGGKEEDIEKIGLAEAIESSFSDFFTYNFAYYTRCIPFYIESDNQISDSITNDTTESTLSGTVNSFSDQARELQFLLGWGSSEIGVKYDDVKGEVENFQDRLGNILTNNHNNIFSNLVDSIQTVTTGGRLVFPEIWSDSKFGKNYNVTIKLATPDKDKLSWYLNIYVPLVHLLGLCLPRQNGQQGYSAPFLVRAYYKGFFNIDMGIITNMTVNKGKESGWTPDGLPTYVEVQLEIKDLYQELSMGAHENLFQSKVLTNTAEMDYLANLCGVNINAPDIEKLPQYWYAINSNGISDHITLDIWGGLQDVIGNTRNTLWNKIIGRLN